MDVTGVSKIFEGVRITQGNVDETVVGKGGHHGKSGGFLTTALGA